MPPTRDGYMKFIRDIPLANTIDHKPSKTRFSTTPIARHFLEWTHPENLPEALRNELLDVFTCIYGNEEAESFNLEQVR